MMSLRHQIDGIDIMGTEATLRSTVVVLMHASGESQRDLAAGIGLPQSQISRRQRGEVPWTLADVDALAAHWGMSVLDLLAGPTHAEKCLPAARRSATLGGSQTMIRP
jgi:transcriptional regulator with XRE-family HTH domain